MRICSISHRLGRGFRALGHEVLVIWPQQAGVLDLAQELDRKGFVPELIVQQEHLGPRTVLTGMEHFDCPRIFWAVDSHLNLSWHRLYAQRFDGVMSPHLSLWQEVNYRRRPVRRLLPVGQARGFTPHTERPFEVGFVGRLSMARMNRSWLMEFLRQRYTACLSHDAAYAEMLDGYDRSRMVPNESILMEVNFRLFEGASCGSLVLSQEVGEDQEAAFATGSEILTYSHVLELKSLLDWHRTRPEVTERMGRAAWERVNREHLPEHRARQVLEFAADLARAQESPEEQAVNQALVLYELDRRDLLRQDPRALSAMLGPLRNDPRVEAAMIRMAAEHGAGPEKLAPLLLDIMNTRRAPGSVELGLCCSMAALRMQQWELALAFLIRFKAARRSPRNVSPQGAHSLCLEWARELRRLGALANPGFAYDPGVHLPRSALDCLFLAMTLDPGDMKPHRLVDSWLSGRKGSALTRMGSLSELWLRDKGNWRLGLELATLDLESYRLDQGREELLLAWRQAGREGAKERFMRRLQGLDPRGAMRRFLESVQKG